MNDLERLKRAEEAGPMAVLVMEMPECCDKCPVFRMDGRDICCGASANHMMYSAHRPDWCPLHKAIGIIEPNGHVKYLREEEE